MNVNQYSLRLGKVPAVSDSRLAPRLAVGQHSAGWPEIKCKGGTAWQAGSREGRQVLHCHCGGIFNSLADMALNQHDDHTLHIGGVP